MTAIRNKSSGDLKGKETKRSPEEVRLEHVAPGVRTEMVLLAVIMFVQGIPFLICVATQLGYIFADGCGELSVTSCPSVYS